MVGLLIAIFLGWLGGYRFYKRQTGLGILYLLTFGIFGIGWIVDIISALKEMPSKAKPFTMQIEIKGAFAECKKNPMVKRYAVVNGLKVGTELGIEIAYFENAPYYQLLAPDGLDIGAFPSEVSRMILTKYPHAKIKAILTDKTDCEHPYAQIQVSP